MNIPDHEFSEAHTILDVGGWFKPEPRATHVIDLMPWETRGAALTPSPLPHERFTKATWFQTDFLRPQMKLPFADKYFDLVVCGHTIEDLADPGPLLAEMQRVGKRGIIECPSRLTEQTQGMRDRESSQSGHPHHHWIMESIAGDLVLFSKKDSELSAKPRLVPLLFTEQQLTENETASITVHRWHDQITRRLVTGGECRVRAEEFVATLQVPPRVRTKDALLRFARRTKSRLHRRRSDDFSWWPKIVELSRPYSTIALK